jgi:hypothetical protein
MKEWKPATPVLRRRYDFDRKGVPLGVWILGLVLFAVFVEVWQVTRVSELTYTLDKTDKSIAEAQARRDYLDAQLAATRTRLALENAAHKHGMKPAEPSQIVVVPAAYLADGPGAEEGGRFLVALGRRVAESFVPTARAKSRRTSPQR